MPEQLSTLMHDSVDGIEVPRPDAVGIAGRGRALRTRRRVAATVVTAVVVGAVGLGGVVLEGSLDGAPRNEHPPVTRQDDPTSTYDAWSAWSVTGEVSIGGTPVRLPGGDAYHLAQTSAGVVAQYLTASSGAEFALVRPDGSTSPLSIPTSTPTIDGDISAPRVAWLVTRKDEVVLHVWDVTTDSELARITVPSPGTQAIDGRQVIQSVDLDGDVAYFGKQDGGARRVEWRTGRVDDLQVAPQSVRNDVATARDGDRWVVIDPATGEVRRPIDGTYLSATVSPDGAWLYLVAADVTKGYVVPVAGGTPVLLDGLTAMATWSPDGHVVGQVGATPELLRCSTAGVCESRQVAGDDASAQSVLVADFLNVG